MSATPSTARPDSVRIADFPSHVGGCATCSEDLDYGCSALPVDRGYVHEECWDDYLHSNSPAPAPAPTEAP